MSEPCTLTRAEAEAGGNVTAVVVEDHPFMIGVEWAARIAEGNTEPHRDRSEDTVPS